MICPDRMGHQMGFIIVHESAHEWFGNNITSNDIADMWVHEGFTNYSETLFTEYCYGKKQAMNIHGKQAKDTKYFSRNWVLRCK